ncbi:MAG: hypothetical protein GXO00_01515 [Candidatus Diapherotrites archaeon]|nr:hypothetical protein [Candidatus Diapherotrites archaeon]
MVSLEALRKRVLEQTKKKLAEAYTEKDRYVIQAIEALDDVDATFNLLVARVREWYSLHFPELNTILKDHEKYLTLVVTFGKRENYNLEALKELVGERDAEVIMNAVKESSGTDIGDEDIRVIQRLAEIALDLRNYRKELVDYIDRTMEEVAPNVKYLAGPLLGARLIAKAGGLKKLSLMPASTIQVLGAEKALFRHLTKGSKPPKHGILFQHPWVRTAKRWQRGKIARSLAAKLAIAAREDYFGGKFIADRLKQELEERVKEIKEKYREPPKKKEQKPRRGKKKRKKR